MCIRDRYQRRVHGDIRQINTKQKRNQKPPKVMKSTLSVICLALLLSLSFSSNAVECGDSGEYCPNGYTCCKLSEGWGCCPYSEGNCCAYQNFCCPSGYGCTDSGCRKSGFKIDGLFLPAVGGASLADKSLLKKLSPAQVAIEDTSQVLEFLKGFARGISNGLNVTSVYDCFNQTQWSIFDLKDALLDVINSDPEKKLQGVKELGEFLIKVPDLVHNCGTVQQKIQAAIKTLERLRNVKELAHDALINILVQGPDLWANIEGLEIAIQTGNVEEIGYRVASLISIDVRDPKDSPYVEVVAQICFPSPW
eukprot:TRINITY_DN1185_c0_g1_i1.p1 TRINITY_DN1185_c0_g1~~TRINITY_DN1185_c0_g1_i1.p1  ORF type:complete len:308 (+),score=95.06 TRINITY_DN1185_c0_g1_i1:67-990(+)